MSDHRDLAAWDAEIEAEFQSVVARTKAAGQRKRGQRLVGVPIAFMAEVRRSTEGAGPLVVALLIYRRTFVSATGRSHCPAPNWPSWALIAAEAQGADAAGCGRAGPGRVGSARTLGCGDPAVET